MHQVASEPPSPFIGLAEPAIYSIYLQQAPKKSGLNRSFAEVGPTNYYISVSCILRYGILLYLICLRMKKVQMVIPEKDKKRKEESITIL